MHNIIEAREKRHFKEDNVIVKESKKAIGSLIGRESIEVNRSQIFDEFRERRSKLDYQYKEGGILNPSCSKKFFVPKLGRSRG